METEVILYHHLKKLFEHCGHHHTRFVVKKNF